MGSGYPGYPLRALSPVLARRVAVPSSGLYFMSSAFSAALSAHASDDESRRGRLVYIPPGEGLSQVGEDMDIGGPQKKGEI